jgi:hypothetical protein
MSAGDLSQEFIAETSEKAKGWKSTFSSEPFPSAPVHIGAGWAAAAAAAAAWS